MVQERLLPRTVSCLRYFSARNLSMQTRLHVAYIPKNIIVRRYYEGIDNLFKIYMPIVDTWVLVNNSETPRSIVATGGKDQELFIRNSVLYKKLEEYVKR